MTAEQELDSILTNNIMIYSEMKKKLLAWHHRHSGRPSKEQIVAVLAKHKIIEELYSLYPAPAPRRVSREEIEDILFKHSDSRFGAGNPRIISLPITALIDDLTKLLNGDGGKEWCSHTRWDKFKDGDGSWYLKETPDSEEVCVPKHWDICPVAGCHARRPSE